MILLTHLVKYLEDSLRSADFSDYCPNGLQIQGAEEVVRLATGVTASQALLDIAIDWGASAILVHHGYFWNGDPKTLVGYRRRRLRTLLENDVSLLAYHLPLDAHPEFGNNACFGRMIGIDESEPLYQNNPQGIGNVGDLISELKLHVLVDRIRNITEREPLLIGDSDSNVRRVAWCTGAAQSGIEAAIIAKADVYISGEVSEQTFHIANEEGIAYIAAGHHATERYGVRSLGEHLAENFDIEHRFIDIVNPI